MEYQVKIIRSKRRTIAVCIKNGEVTVRAPLFYPEYKINEFLHEKKNWIEKHLLMQKPQEVEKYPNQEIKSLKKIAKPIIIKKVEYFSKIIGVKYNAVSIRAQKTLWGSCTAKKTLNFNCLLLKAPESVLDYVIIHELCHLKEMNHSSRFWALVKKYLPNYKTEKDWLKREGVKLLYKI